MYNTVLNNAKELETYSFLPLPLPFQSINFVFHSAIYRFFATIIHSRQIKNILLILSITYSTKVFTINTIVTHTRNPSDLSSTYLA